jgi:hypothetical protein
MEQHKIMSILDRFYPLDLKENTFSHIKMLTKAISDRWTLLRVCLLACACFLFFFYFFFFFGLSHTHLYSFLHQGFTSDHCTNLYLSNLYRWPFFGATFYDAQVS